MSVDHTGACVRAARVERRVVERLRLAPSETFMASPASAEREWTVARRRCGSNRWARSRVNREGSMRAAQGDPTQGGAGNSLRREELLVECLEQAGAAFA